MLHAIQILKRMLRAEVGLLFVDNQMIVVVTIVILNQLMYQFVHSFILIYFLFSRAQSTQMSGRNDYFLRQIDIHPDYRSTVMDWIHQVCVEYRIELDVMVWTATLFDAFLSRTSTLIVAQKLQLLGCTCFWMAIQMRHRDREPCADDLVALCANAYTWQEVCRERERECVCVCMCCNNCCCSADFDSNLAVFLLPAHTVPSNASPSNRNARLLCQRHLGGRVRRALSAMVGHVCQRRMGARQRVGAGG
jgi:hypothetical protein